MLSVPLLMRWWVVLRASPPASCESINLQELEDIFLRLPVLTIFCVTWWESLQVGHTDYTSLCWSETPQHLLRISSSLAGYNWPLFLTCPYILPYKEYKAQLSVVLITLFNTRHALTFLHRLSKKVQYRDSKACLVENWKEITWYSACLASLLRLSSMNTSLLRIVNTFPLTKVQSNRYTIKL